MLDSPSPAPTTPREDTDNPEDRGAWVFLRTRIDWQQFGLRRSEHPFWPPRGLGSGYWSGDDQWKEEESRQLRTVRKILLSPWGTRLLSTELV